MIRDDDPLKDAEDESAEAPVLPPVAAPVEAEPVESALEDEVPKPDGHLATKPLFSDDEGGDDDDDIHIPPAPASNAAPAPAPAAPAASAAPPKLFDDDDDDDWGHDDDPLSFLKK